MPLSNSQFNEILRDYDERQAVMRADLERKEREIEETIPEYAQLTNQIIDNSMMYAKASFYYGKEARPSLKELKKKNEELSKKKIRLLTEKGYSEDYLMPKYKCPDCKDTGYVGSKQCHCFKQAIVDLLYRQSNLSEILEEENFEKFTLNYYCSAEKDKITGLTSRENMRRIYDEAQKYVNNFDDSFENLLFYGGVGLGKTYMTHCIAKALLDSAHTVIYLSASKLFEILGSNMRQENNFLERNASTEHILDCDLLIIDDLGEECVNAFTLSNFGRCINERFTTRRSTIISTNLGQQELQETYGERNFSRMLSNYKVFRFFGEDIRLRKKKLA